MQNKVLPDRIVIVINSYDANNTPQMYKDNPLIEIIYSDVDIKGHNKYYHTMLKYPDSVIITIDDDVIYPSTFIEDCINAYNNSPSTINAGRVHKIKYDNGKMLSYKLWDWESQETEASYDLFFTGVGGVVYPPGVFKDDLNLELIKEYINVDDILLNYLCRKQGIKIKRIPLRDKYEDVNIIPFKIKLCSTNLMFNNDICLHKIQFEKLLTKYII